MNVLQAVKKLNDYKDRLRVLDIAIDKFKQSQESYEDISSYEIQLLTEIKEEIKTNHDQLQHKLEITPLVTTREVK